MTDKHREAELLSVEAAEAADAEKAALATVSAEKLRTRSVLAVSVASLLYKAGRFDEAELGIFSVIGKRFLEPWSERQLRELLQIVTDERVLAAGKKRYSGEAITLALRGGEIGSGTGPLDLVLEKAGAFRSLLYRVAEWKGDYPLRTRGKPAKELWDLVEARVAEPVPGSYTLEVRLTEPLQSDLFGPQRVQPQDVSDGLFQFLDGVTHGSRESLEQLVPRREYRKALLQLTKAVLPKGRRVKEVGVYRTRKETLESVYLTDSLPRRIREAMPPPDEPEGKRRQIRGTLRALHLDKNWLEVVTPDGRHETCDTVHDMLDDIVGPMVNEEVVVTGVMRYRWRRQRLLADDVEPADEA